MDARENEPEERQAGGTPTPARGGDGRFTRSVETAGRDAEAARLRTRHYSYRQIARELGMSSVSNAYEAVQRAIAEVPREAGAEALHFELERLDELARGAAEEVERALGVFQARHLVTNNRGVVEWEGEPLEDDGPKLAAIDRMISARRLILSVMERRAKLLGLDAETKVKVDEKLTYEIVGVDLDKI